MVIDNVILHPKARRPEPKLSTDPLPDEAIPAYVAGSLLEQIRKCAAGLAELYGAEGAELAATLAVREAIRGNC